MRRRWILLFVICTLILTYFIWKIKKGSFGSNVVVKAAQPRSLKLIEERIQTQKKQVESNNTNPPYKSITVAPKEIEKNCWEKIRDQYQKNPDYLQGNRHELNLIVGEWFYKKNNYSTDATNVLERSPQGMFFLALAKGGLLEGRTLALDEQQALLLLDQVATADPGNSAPLLFAAIIEARIGNHVRKDELLHTASQSTHFDSYLKDFTFALFDGVRTPSDLLAAQEVWSTAPIPNYLPLQNIIKESQKYKIAEQLVHDGLRSDRERMEDLSWIPIEYATGKMLLKIFGKDSNVPSYQDLMRINQDPLGQATERAVSELDSSCDLASISDEVQNIRKYLKRVRSQGL
jgi:hypothetical protein